MLRNVLCRLPPASKSTPTPTSSPTLTASPVASTSCVYNIMLHHVLTTMTSKRNLPMLARPVVANYAKVSHTADGQSRHNPHPQYTTFTMVWGIWCNAKPMQHCSPAVSPDPDTSDPKALKERYPLLKHTAKKDSQAINPNTSSNPGPGPEMQSLKPIP